ncbi:MAG TPA: NAD(P)H-dependent oxidoreductase [Syntrophales bacterium]|nr:NAD(P)H-dependent oxidoreductase [Syntrophales bacterium]
MKIAVLNGSPKGPVSVTMQYVRYLQETFPGHVFRIHHVAQQIRKLEKNEPAFEEILDDIRASEAVLWAFPLYYCLVSSQYKRFIELIWERGAADAFRGRYAAALSTSIHFFDHTAHAYIRALCDDLEMHSVAMFSASMHDLLHRREREQFRLFAEDFLDAVERRAPAARIFPPVPPATFHYEPGTSRGRADAGGRGVLILTDGGSAGSNIGGMVARLRLSFAGPVDVVNIRELDIRGGCLGCIRCGYDNTCAYKGRDGYIDFYNSAVKKADILVFAGEIRDRYLSAAWKQFFDRSFFNTHIPTLKGKQVCFLVSGPLSANPHLREIFQGTVEFQGANLTGIVTDEVADSAKLDALLDALAEQAVRCAERGCFRPALFPGVAGAKLFRDEMWGRLRFPFVADHRYYRRHGLYDFPQKDLGAQLRNLLLTSLCLIPSVRRDIYERRLKEEMVKPFRRLFKTAGSPRSSRSS